MQTTWCVCDSLRRLSDQHGTVWLYMATWLYMTIRLYMAMWLYGCMATAWYGYINIFVYIYIYIYGYLAIWLDGYGMVSRMLLFSFRSNEVGRTSVGDREV